MSPRTQGGGNVPTGDTILWLMGCSFGGAHSGALQGVHHAVGDCALSLFIGWLGDPQLMWNPLIGRRCFKGKGLRLVIPGSVNVGGGGIEVDAIKINVF
mmetsp:Transcript_6570/g.16334  ORF Transcript_6570/g.16334 Transcript_6570/m.16334 type:complete len:99 (-) Transcript_6570:1602-1898(-)